MPQRITKPNDVKVFILYLMEKIGYPLDFDTISTIVIQDDIVNFFDFAQCFGELEDAGHVEKLEPEYEGGTVTYRLSATGKAVSDGLNTTIARSIKERSYRSALRHMNLTKRKAVIDHNVELDGDGFLFHGKIKDSSGVQLDVALRAENESQLHRMESVFTDRPDVVLKGLTALLTGDLDFAIGDYFPSEKDD